MRRPSRTQPRRLPWSSQKQRPSHLTALPLSESSLCLRVCPFSSDLLSSPRTPPFFSIQHETETRLCRVGPDSSIPESKPCPVRGTKLRCEFRFFRHRATISTTRQRGTRPTDRRLHSASLQNAPSHKQHGPENRHTQKKWPFLSTHALREQFSLE